MKYQITVTLVTVTIATSTQTPVQKRHWNSDRCVDKY